MKPEYIYIETQASTASFPSVHQSGNHALPGPAYAGSVAPLGRAALTATWAAIALGSGVRPLRLQDRRGARARPIRPNR